MKRWLTIMIAVAGIEGGLLLPSLSSASSFLSRMDQLREMSGRDHKESHTARQVQPTLL